MGKTLGRYVKSHGLAHCPGLHLCMLSFASPWPHQPVPPIPASKLLSLCTTGSAYYHPSTPKGATLSIPSSLMGASITHGHGVATVCNDVRASMKLSFFSHEVTWMGYYPPSVHYRMFLIGANTNHLNTSIPCLTWFHCRWQAGQNGRSSFYFHCFNFLKSHQHAGSYKHGRHDKEQQAG